MLKRTHVCMRRSCRSMFRIYIILDSIEVSEIPWISPNFNIFGIIQIRLYDKVCMCSVWSDSVLDNDIQRDAIDYLKREITIPRGMLKIIYVIGEHTDLCIESSQSSELPHQLNFLLRYDILDRSTLFYYTLHEG